MDNIYSRKTVIDFSDRPKVYDDGKLVFEFRIHALPPPNTSSLLFDHHVKCNIYSSIKAEQIFCIKSMLMLAMIDPSPLSNHKDA